MQRRAIALVLVALLSIPVGANDRDLPADIAADVESLAAQLDESIANLSRPGALARETQLAACDLRFQAIRCELRGLAREPATKLTAWAARLECEGVAPGECRGVCNELTDWLADQRLRRQVRELLAGQHRIGSAIRTLQWDYTPEYDQARGEPQIEELPLLLIKPGQTLSVRQGVSWRQFPRDTVAIDFASSDRTNLIVPARRVLNFEANSTDFEYEIRAVARGDYAIRLTPEVGESILVHVSVR